MEEDESYYIEMKEDSYEGVGSPDEVIVNGGDGVGNDESVEYADLVDNSVAINNQQYATPTTRKKQEGGKLFLNNMTEMSSIICQKVVPSTILLVGNKRSSFRLPTSISWDPFVQITQYLVY